MTEAATLMFGLGATRAGSTWLYRYLADHPDCDLPRVKELHYFKAREDGGEARQLKRLQRISKRIARLKAKAPDDALPRLSKWLDDVDGLRDLYENDRGTDAYLRYLQEGRMGQLHGDITPSYALLPVERLTEMASLTPNVKFTLLLRDPVDRLWSNLRQAARLKAEKDVDEPSHELIERHLERLFDRHLGGLEKGIMQRSDYRGILSRVSKAFPREQIFVEFYERLFCDDTVARLCAFLGISNHKADFSRNTNVADKMSMTPAQRAKARRELADQYDAVEDFMGALPERWMANRPAPRAAEMKV